ncbi:MAG: aminomethyl-transferring glycine dehydrogenase subunit GcvPA [Candidatus Firestonebacteria bacterium]
MQFPYLPHTDEDIKEMLRIIGVKSIDDLFKDIPETLRLKKNLNLPEAKSELEVRQELHNIASKNCNTDEYISFLGAGAYDHFIPSVVKYLSNRSEFCTSYTPYQAEVSQGILQVFFEYQTMICELTKMDVSNASMYDGSTALVEAVFMAYNTNNKKKVILPRCLHPEYKEVLKTYTKNLEIVIEEVNCTNGIIDLNDLKDKCKDDVGCVIIQQPNFFGCIEDVIEIEKIVHKCGAIFIACVDPISLGILIPPGEYEADIAVGEGQALGNDLNFGGPYLGFFSAKKEFMRNIPGRIIGETVDKEGKRAFTLTLQTREQHIRREKATSNICSNESLCAVASTIYLSLLGKEGIKEVGNQCLQKSHFLKENLCKTSNFKEKFSSPFFKEFVVESSTPINKLNKKLFKNKIIGGIDLGRFFPELKNNMLICVTEKRTEDEMNKFIEVASHFIWDGRKKR